MTSVEMKEALVNFATRIRFLEADFARLLDDFDAYEDEAGCAWCGKKSGALSEKCEYCGSDFCADCWKRALECAQAKKAKSL